MKSRFFLFLIFLFAGELANAQTAQMITKIAKGSQGADIAAIQSSF